MPLPHSARSGWKGWVAVAGAGIGIGFATLFAGSGAAPAPPVDLLWPLGIDAGVTASFGEYRGDRFHGGLDLSTRGETGHPVVAAADGDLFRLKIEWRGYGRAVYIRHAGGWVTVYAHLDRLENDRLGLADRVAVRRRQAGTPYPGDIYLSPPVPVRRGDRIGWSGQAGAGGPHLHFELRDPENRPVDPIGHRPGWIDDRRPPRLEAITLHADGADTFIDGHLRHLRLPLTRRGDQYGTDIVPIVTGPFTATLEVVDPMAPRYRLGPAEIAAGLDEGARFDFALARFDFSHTRLAGLVFDLDASRLAPAVYSYRLVRRPGNRFARGPERFVADTPGLRTLWFEAADASGNRSRGRLLLLAGTAPRLRDAAVRQEPVGTEIAFQYDAGIADRIEARSGETLRIEFAPSPTNGQPPRVAATADTAAIGAVRIETSTPGASSRWWYRLQSARFRSRWQRLPATENGPPAVSAPTEPSGTIDWDLEMFGDGADLRFRIDPTPPEPPAVRVGAGRQEKPAPVTIEADGRFAAALPLAAIGSNPVSLFVGGRSGGPLPIRLFRPAVDRDTEIAAFGARLRVPAGAQYEPEVVALSAPPAMAGTDLPRRGGPVRIQPTGAVFRRSVGLAIDPVGVEAGSPRLGIYRWDRHRQRWGFVGPTGTGVAWYNQVEIRRGGTYVLLEDDQPPELFDPRPAAGTEMSSARMAELRIGVRDRGAGIDWDGVRFRLDGEPCETEYDPDRNLAFCRPASLPGPGPHRIEIEATDRAGNRSRFSPVEFRVSP